MTSRSRFALVAAAAALTGLVAGAALAPAAAAKDSVGDLEKLRKKREDFRKKKKDEGLMPFFDLSYAANPKLVKESRWSQADPPSSDAAEDKGLQLRCGFSLDITKGNAIDLLCQKFLHKTPDGKGKYTMNWEKAGVQCDTADAKKMIEGAYLDAKRTLKSVNDGKCVEPKKTGVGPASMYASVQGIDPESQKPTRKDYYMWTDANTTWLLWVVFDEKFLDEKSIMEKAEEFIGTIKELKGAPSK